MRLTHNSSCYARTAVQAVLEQAKIGIDTTGWEVEVRAAPAGVTHLGQAFPARVGVLPRRPLATIVLGPPELFPLLEVQRSFRGPRYDLVDWQEALLVTAARLFRRLQQYKYVHPGSVVDGERWAYRRLTHYRAGLTPLVADSGARKVS